MAWEKELKAISNLKVTATGDSANGRKDVMTPMC